MACNIIIKNDLSYVIIKTTCHTFIFIKSKIKEEDFYISPTQKEYIELLLRDIELRESQKRIY